MAENLNETLLNLNNVVNIQSSINIVVEALNLNDYIKKTLDTLNAQVLSKVLLLSIKCLKIYSLIITVLI